MYTTFTFKINCDPFLWSIYICFHSLQLHLNRFWTYKYKKYDIYAININLQFSDIIYCLIIAFFSNYIICHSFIRLIIVYGSFGNALASNTELSLLNTIFSTSLKIKTGAFRTSSILCNASEPPHNLRKKLTIISAVLNIIENTHFSISSQHLFSQNHLINNFNNFNLWSSQHSLSSI